MEQMQTLSMHARFQHVILVFVSVFQRRHVGTNVPLVWFYVVWFNHVLCLVIFPVDHLMLRKVSFLYFELDVCNMLNPVFRQLQRGFTMSCKFLYRFILWKYFRLAQFQCIFYHSVHSEWHAFKLSSVSESINFSHSAHFFLSMFQLFTENTGVFPQTLYC